MRLVLILSVLTLIPGPAAAQAQSPAERDAVLASVQAFFDTMAAKDATGASRVLMAEGRFHSVRDVDGKPTIRTSTVADYLRNLPTGKAAQRERMWSPEVRIRGSIASVWTPYDFWTNGMFSHCGIDAFNLMKTDMGWQIADATYTVETVGCQPSPLGPLK